MGVFLPNGYGLFKPTFTLAGSTKIFQTAVMFKNDTGLDALSAGNQIRGYWVAAGGPANAAQMYIGYTLAQTESYVMAGGILTYALNNTAVVGTKAGSLGTPINTSVIVRKVTGIVGKRYRGRIMLPNMWATEAGISQAGIMDAATVAAVQGIWTTAFTPWAAGSCPPMLGHSVSEIAPNFVTAMTVNDKLGSMPHRIRGF